MERFAPLHFFCLSLKFPPKGFFGKSVSFLCLNFGKVYFCIVVFIGKVYVKKKDSSKNH